MTDPGEVLSLIRDAIIVLDGDRKVVAWMGSAERMLGWAEPEVIGHDVDELLTTRDANGNACPLGLSGKLARMRGVKGMPEQEYLIATSSGTDLWVGVTCSLERDELGSMTRTIAVARDISRRKRIDLAKSEVISAVSHELRSPLTSVKGFTSTLLHKWDKFDDDTKKHLLLTINTDADRVTRLIGELLDVSRLEAGRLELRKRLIDLPEISHRVVSRVKDSADMHQVSVAFPDAFPEVLADADKVEQVLTNLVENAIKYTESGAVMVSGSADDAFISISVTDHGNGIDPDHRLHVFGKFFRRGDRARAENPTGTGLGLYISKGLVEAHGGRIWVDDAPGAGAVFTFTLPRS